MTELPGFGLEVDEREHGGRCTVLLSGELDIATAPRVQESIDRVLARGSTRVLTLDLSGLEFIDSSGLEVIVHACSACEQSECEFGVIRGPDVVQRVFELSGLAATLPLRRATPAADDS
jgi:anti-sigma B factor antagonist